MHVKSLKVFCDVVGKRSFSRAADDNGLSQSGVSQMVHQLEEQLGVKLLDRSKRPFVLTAEGKVYYDGCRKLVQRLSALEEEVRSLHQQVAGRVSIASIYSVGLSHLSDLVRDFSEKHPQAEVLVEYHHPDRIYELVEQDGIDLGVVSYPKSTRTIKGMEWLEEPVLLVCSPRHALADRSRVHVSELRNMEFIGFDEDLKVRHQFDRALSAVNVEVDVVMEFDNIETIKRAIEINDGLSFLPEPTVRGELERGTLVAVPLLGLELTRPIGLIKRSGVQLGKTARRFIQMFQPHDAEDDYSFEDSSRSGNDQMVGK